MRADQIMTPEVITVGADASIVEAIHKMLQHHVSGLPVVDAEGKLIGIISEGDFIRRAEIGTERKRGRWLNCLVGPDQIAADFVREHGRKVRQIMTPDPVTVAEHTSLAQIVPVMESYNVKRLPVLRGDRLVGIVTRSDFLPCRLNVMVRDGVVSLGGVVKSEKARQAAIVAAENVPDVKKVQNHLCIYPSPEDDLGGGDFVSLQEQPSTQDDEPL